MTVLVHTDLRGIQRYVFGSPQLRDAVGRSAVIRLAVARNCGPLADATKDTGAVIVSAAGGGSVVQCADAEAGQRFARRYSRLLLDLSPDLDPVMTTLEMTGSLARTLGQLPVHTMRSAGSWPGHIPLPGLTVTRQCQASGLPAEMLDTTRSPAEEAVTHAVWAARDQVKTTTTEMEKMLLDNVQRQRFRLPIILDHLGRSSGERSLRAVLHIDLDRLGLRLAKWRAERENQPEPEFREDLAKIEDGVEEFVTGLARCLVSTAAEAAPKPDTGQPTSIIGHPAELSFPLKIDPDGVRVNLPVRPVLVGGDDLTLITDGRLGWSLAAAAFDYLAVNNPPPSLAALGGVWEQPLTACAGLAVVPVGFPFDRAYSISETLCSRAKSAAEAEEEKSGQPRQSTVTWFLGDAHELELPDSLPSYGATQYKQFLRDYLDPGQDNSLRDKRWARRRSWIRGPLAGTVRTALAKNQTRKEIIKAVPLPAGITALPGQTSDLNWPARIGLAVELLDRHLQLAPETRAPATVPGETK